MPTTDLQPHQQTAPHKAGSISLCHAALLSPLGNLHETFARLCAGKGEPGRLEKPLLDILGQFIAEGPWQPDLLLLASTKGDGPCWIEDCLAEGKGRGGPGWLVEQLTKGKDMHGLAVSMACASGPAAVAVAELAINQGAYQRVLVLGADRLCPMIEQGFADLQAIDPRGAHPFDADRRGLSLGETAAALWFSCAGDGPIFLQGWGASCDANHLTGPHRQGKGLLQACRDALGADGAQCLDAVISHGTGTRYNDESEALAYAQICPEALITGWKGALGHSLGACGVSELALGWLALQRQLLPGIIGLLQPGVSPALHLLPAGGHAQTLRRLLSANAGFGGLNAAVCIGQEARALRPPKSSASTRLIWACRLGVDGIELEVSGQQCQHWPWSQLNVEPAALPRLTARQVCGETDPSWGRMDQASRLAVSLLALARRQGGLAAPPAESAMILLSDRGCAESDRAVELARQQGRSEPQRFAYTLPSTPLGELSIRAGLIGPAFCLPGAKDGDGRELAAWLLQRGAPLVLVLRIEADQPPHCAWMEAYGS